MEGADDEAPPLHRGQFILVINGKAHILPKASPVGHPAFWKQVLAVL